MLRFRISLGKPQQRRPSNVKKMLGSPLFSVRNFCNLHCVASAAVSVMIPADFTQHGSIPKKCRVSPCKLSGNSTTFIAWLLRQSGPRFLRILRRTPDFQKMQGFPLFSVRKFCYCRCLVSAAVSVTIPANFTQHGSIPKNAGFPPVNCPEILLFSLLGSCGSLGHDVCKFDAEL